MRQQKADLAPPYQVRYTVDFLLLLENLSIATHRSKSALMRQYAEEYLTPIIKKEIRKYKKRTSNAKM